MKTLLTAARFFLLLAAVAQPLRAQNAVDNLYLEAHKAENANHFAEAIKLWSEVIKLEPKDATAYFNRAVDFEDDKKTDKALADYATAIQIDPTDPQPYQYRARIYAAKAQEVSGQNDADPDAKDKPDWDKAIADYTAAVTIAIKDVPAADRYAWADQKVKDLGSTKDYNMAMTAACWSAIIKLNPDDARAWFKRAGVDPSVDDPDLQLTDLNEAIRLDPKNLEAFKMRAACYQETGAKDKSAADYTEIIRLSPDKAAYTSRAQLYDNLKQYDKAAADYTEVIRLSDQPDAASYSARADAYSGMQEWDKAIADETKVIELNADSDSYHARAGTYYDKKDWDNVIADMTKCMELDVKESKAQVESDKQNGDTDAKLEGDGIPGITLILRGDAWARKGAYDKALADFRHASANDAADWNAVNAEAWLLATCPDAKFRDGAKAMKLATASCLGTGWVDAPALDTLAAAEAETGKWDDAIKHEKLALEVAADEDADQKEQEVDHTADYTAHLALYEKKQPCRDWKQLEW